MPTFSDNTFASYFRRILQIGNSGNTGTPTTTTAVEAGNGVATSISLSDDVLKVQPQVHDTTGAFLVNTQSGSTILSVDTTNSKVKCGTSQINALTQYKVFNSVTLAPTGVGNHMILGGGNTEFSASGVTEVALGSGTDPATTLDVSAETAESFRLLPLYWYLPDAITIVSAHVLMGTSAANDDTLNFHLMSYAIDTSSNYGDLSGGVVIADSGTTSAVDEDVIKVTTMTNLPTDVATGRVILATVESDNVNPLSVQMIVKYHIQ